VEGGGEEGPVTEDQLRVLDWHWANLEYGCSAAEYGCSAALDEVRFVWREGLCWLCLIALLAVIVQRPNNFLLYTTHFSLFERSFGAGFCAPHTLPS